MTPCQPQVLYQEHRLCIARCTHCRRISLMYFNVMAGFSPPDFDGFCRNVLAVDFDAFSAQFPDGEPTLVLRTCHPDIQFSFNRHEFEQLRSALTESLLMLQVQQVLEDDKRSGQRPSDCWGAFVTRCKRAPAIASYSSPPSL